MRKKGGIAAAFCFWLVFAVMLTAGRYTYRDYGITVDEKVERESTLINYQYAFEQLTGRDLGLMDTQLHEYRDRYYGVALQMPMVAVEHLTGFTMPDRDAYMLRHFYTFCLCMCGWFCFYHFCRIVFKNRWMALAGFLMITLYPRFWGEQFTNIKDMVFAAACCASMLGVALCLENEGKLRYEVLGAALFALCANTRIIGLMFPALLFGYRILRDWLTEGKQKKTFRQWVCKDLSRYVLNVLLMFVFYLLVTPAAWSNPFDFLKNVFTTFSNYTTWGGQVPFLDRMYPGKQLPGYYLIVWVGISAPLWYLACMLLGAADGGVQLVRSIREKQTAKWFRGQQRYLLFCMTAAFVPLLMPFVMQVTLYNSWRHMYFVFPALIVLALFGIQAMGRALSRRKIIRWASVCTAAVLLCGQTAWICLNHPYEKVYFNPAGRQVADTVDRDYWAESAVHPLQVILRNDHEERISIASDWIIGITVFHFLPEEQMNRFYVYYNGAQTVDYFVDAADTVEPETFEGYTPVYEHRMRDGLLLSTVWMKNDVLQERFGGVYPETNVEK